jgi:hypothetical protein
MNNKASPTSTNPTKQCSRVLFPYFPSSEGRLAGERTVPVIYPPENQGIQLIHDKHIYVEHTDLNLFRTVFVIMYVQLTKYKL